jgi:hypothetical protein
MVRPRARAVLSVLDESDRGELVLSRQVCDPAGLRAQHGLLLQGHRIRAVPAERQHGALPSAARGEASTVAMEPHRSARRFTDVMRTAPRCW